MRTPRRKKAKRSEDQDPITTIFSRTPRGSAVQIEILEDTPATCSSVLQAPGPSTLQIDDLEDICDDAEDYPNTVHTPPPLLDWITPAETAALGYPPNKLGAEKALRAFDMDPTYGPCRGIPRSARFLRAKKHNLDPPSIVMHYITKFHLDSSVFDQRLGA